MDDQERMSMKSGIRQRIVSVPKLIAAVLGVMILGSLPSVITITGPGSWYARLVKPAFQPPNWIFGPVWVLLFLLMGIAAYLVWERGAGRPEVRRALTVFGIQFAFNILWSLLFFGLRAPLISLLDIIILWWLILATILAFYRVRKSAAYLLLPYIAWVSFALVLNASIVFLNP